MRVKWLRNKRYIVTVLMEGYVNMNVHLVYCAYKYRVDAYSENYSSCTYKWAYKFHIYNMCIQLYMHLCELGYCFSTVDG